MAASSSGYSPSSSSVPLPKLEVDGNFLYLLGREDRESQAYVIAIKHFNKEPEPFRGLVALKNFGISPSSEKPYIDVTMVAMRLGITEEKVREIANRDDGIDLFRRAAAINLFMTNSKLKTKYRDKLQTKYLNSEIKSFKVKKSGLIKGTHYKRYFIDTKEFKLFSSKKIKEGSYSKVFKIFTLIGADDSSDPSSLALKKARSKDRFDADTHILHIAKSGLVNETQILKSIHAQEEIHGIQSSPFLTAEMAYTTRLYDSNLLDMSKLKKFKRMKPKDKLELMGQLVTGLASLHRSGYFHGDVKSTNCLVEIDKSSPKQKISRAVLCDFGGVKQIQAWRENPTIITYTPNYLAPELGGGTFEPRDLTQYSAEILQSNDVFALSKTILEVLIGKLINGTISEKQYKKLTQKIKIPMPLVETLLNGMRNPIANGLTAEKFLNDFKAAFLEVYGEDFSK